MDSAKNGRWIILFKKFGRLRLFIRNIANRYIFLPVFPQLQDDEEELRREEEAYIEAKREAAHIAKLQKQKEEEAAKQTNGPKSWKAGEDGEWEV